MELGGPEDAIPSLNGGQDEQPPMLRLAVISSPRSGNTWVREMLAALYGLEQIPVHFPDGIPWENLPRRCVIQIHWHPLPDFTELLNLCGVRVVAVARHPFDVLLSFLNYTYYVHQEGICPGPEGCNECPIVGASPRSRAFLDYVTGENGRILLGHTAGWWDRPDVLRTRYGDLVADTEAALGDLIRQVGEPPRRPVAEVVEANSLRRMKPNRDVWQYHFWQGRPGLWRSMFPAAEANYLAEAYRDVFETLGYPCDPDPDLQPLQADLNWLQLQLNSTREHLGLERGKHRQAVAEAKTLSDQFRKSEQFVLEQSGILARTSAELAATRVQWQDETSRRESAEREAQELCASLMASRSEFHRTQGELNHVRDQLHATRSDLDAARQQLAPIHELGPRALKWSLRLKRLYRKAKHHLSIAGPAPVPGTSPALFRRRPNPMDRVGR